MPIKAVLFDYGNVLIRWAPENLYRVLIPDASKRAHFLAHVCSMDWHGELDAGAPMDAHIAARAKRFPEHADLIRAWGERFGDMLAGEIEGSIAIADELAAANIPLALLTNMPAEKVDVCFAPFTRLHLFDPVVISGRLRMAKPDARIFAHAVERMGFAAGEILFVDDSASNVAGAERAGLHAHHFTDPHTLRAALQAAKLLPT